MPHSFAPIDEDGEWRASERVLNFCFNVFQQPTLQAEMYLRDAECTCIWVEISGLANEKQESSISVHSIWVKGLDGTLFHQEIFNPYMIVNSYSVSTAFFTAIYIILWYILMFHSFLMRRKWNHRRKSLPSLPIISSFIFSRFSSASGSKRRMVLLAWLFEGSNSKIFFISVITKMKKSSKKMTFEIRSGYESATRLRVQNQTT